MNIKKLIVSAAAFLCAATVNITAVSARPYLNMDLKYDGETHYYSAEEIALEINGRELDDLPMPPVLLNNYTLVPAREVFENLGAEVDWLPDSRQVQIFHENTSVIITINSTTALVNGSDTNMDIPAKIINDKTMVPLRFVSQAIEKEVGWDGSTRTASVKDKQITTPETSTETTTEETTETTTAKPVETTTAKPIETTTAKPVKTASNEMQDIEAIDFVSGMGTDLISISGADYAPKVDITRSADNSLLTIDIENGNLTVAKKDFGDGNFIKNGYYYQVSQKYVRISLELKDTVKYNSSTDGKTTTIVLSEGTGYEDDAKFSISTANYNYVGDNFSFEDDKLIISNSSGKINLNNIKYDDDYLNGEFRITIPENLTSVLSSTSFMIGSEKVNSVDINCTSYNTVITVHENNIIACKTEKAGNYVVFNFVHPSEVYNKIVVLDAGHGLQDNGASGNGLVEKELTLDIELRALDLFENASDIKVYCTRLGDTYPTLTERQDMASYMADAFVSIHINSATSSASGTETYCLYSNDQGNGLTSYMLAERILDKLIASLGTVDRGVKSEEYIVLKGTRPSTLLEMGFISNSDDAAMMGAAVNRQKMAQAIFDGVTELLNEHPPIR